MNHNTVSPFDKYKTDHDPQKREKAWAWATGIGLQDVDGLSVSSYLVELAIKNIEGEITTKEVQALIKSYYETDSKNENPCGEEADTVSTRITPIINEKGFTFSVAQYLSIHKRLFEGICKRAGEIRDYNITKQEWVLDGDTVIYGGASELRATLEYDMSQEKAFDYTGLSMDEIIRHFALFISRLWQIHVFGECNTRTTAVFFIKYLNSLGFNVTNDIFAENAWYFRNALVRANYTNLKKGVHETTEYLELFLRNLLLGEKNPLKNRTLHISGAAKQFIEPQKQYIGDKKQYIDKLLSSGLTQKTATHAVKLFNEFGFESFFSRSDVVDIVGITVTPASALLKKLLDVGITEAVNGMGKGKYRFNPRFFEE